MLLSAHDGTIQVVAFESPLGSYEKNSESSPCAPFVFSGMQLTDLGTNHIVINSHIMVSSFDLQHATLTTKA